MASEQLPMDLPVINLDVYLNNPLDSEEVKAECAKAAQALITYGALVLHDSRVDGEDNDTFLDLLEDYFAQPEEALRKDERPELSYQIGVTLENTEKPKCAVDEPCLDVIQRLHPSQRPLDISQHAPDPKCRFFWRMVEAPPYETQFPGLNAANITPEAAHIQGRWTPTMDKWGTSMKNSSVCVKSGSEILLTLSQRLKVGRDDRCWAGSSGAALQRCWSIRVCHSHHLSRHAHLAHIGVVRIFWHLPRQT